MKDNKKHPSPLLTILFLFALAVFAFSAWRLYSILREYKASENEYAEIEEKYTKPKPTPTATPTPEEKPTEEEKEPEAPARFIEDADPPLTVDFEELQKINPEIVGWLYVDAFPDTISYPILRGTDNEYYLHHTFKKQYLFAGSIFENYENRSDFTDPNTIIYGHNMRNRSMFGNLKFLKEQERYDKHPYFWILTPQGNFRYKIYSVMDVPVDHEVYTMFMDESPQILPWEERLQEASVVKNDVPLEEDDLSVTLSTCTSNSQARCVVVGKLVSSSRPVRTEMRSPVPELNPDHGAQEESRDTGQEGQDNR